MAIGRVLAIAALSLLGAGSALAAKLDAALIGTWQIVRFEDTDAAGVVTKPFGEHPKGYFVYDATHHLSVQIMATPPVPRFAKADAVSEGYDEATDAEVRKAITSYVAYFGTWRINAAGSVVTHVVEGALDPGYTGTDQERPFRLNGDTLIIGAKEKDGGSYYRELHRVR